MKLYKYDGRKFEIYTSIGNGIAVKLNHSRILILPAAGINYRFNILGHFQTSCDMKQTVEKVCQILIDEEEQYSMEKAGKDIRKFFDSL